MAKRDAAYWRAYYAEHKEQILARQKKSPSRTPEENSEYMRVYYQENKQRWREYLLKHRDERNARRRERYATDAEYREKLKAQANEGSRRHRQRNPFRRKALQYNLTEEQVERMIDGGCQICKAQPYANPDMVWHFDHDHRTGETRGVLCPRCNLALGHLHDDPIIAASMLEYLLRDRNA